jgi:hypothetical protein
MASLLADAYAEAKRTEALGAGRSSLTINRGIPDLVRSPITRGRSIQETLGRFAWELLDRDGLGVLVLEVVRLRMYFLVLFEILWSLERLVADLAQVWLEWRMHCRESGCEAKCQFQFILLIYNRGH